MSSDPSFPIGKLVEFILSQEWDGCENFSPSDILENRVQAITVVYHSFLLEFGFSKDMLLTDVAQFDTMQDIDHAELYKDLIPKLTLSASLDYLFRQLECPLRFGLKDLTIPTSKRTQIFFSVLMNFFLFMSSQHDRVQQIEDSVMRLHGKKQKFLDQIEAFKRENSSHIEKAYSDKVELAEFESEKNKLGNMMESMNALKTEINSMNEGVDLVQTQISQKESRLDDLQRETESIKTVSALDSELAKILNLEQESKLKNYEYQKGRDDIHKLLGEYKTLLDHAAGARQQLDIQRTIMSQAEEMVKAEEDVKMKGEMEERVARELEEKIFNIVSTQNTIMLKWSRRKESKEKEMGEWEAQVAQSTSNCSQERLDRIDLLRSLTGKIEEIRYTIQVKEKESKSNYVRLLESLEMFCEYIRDSFDGLDGANGA